LDSDLFQRERLVISGGTRVKNSTRLFSNEHGLGIKELDSKLLGKPLKVYR
jgi:hypothetical protein